MKYEKYNFYACCHNTLLNENIQQLQRPQATHSLFPIKINIFSDPGATLRLLVQGQMYTIPQNLAPNVNLSYCLDLMTLGSKLMKNSCWTFFQ